jgi:3'-phosphoadenosine 5'-phosphosulfate sulfotransferase (PAPS reductase)/FAD synthetase
MAEQIDILPGMPDALAKMPPKARAYAAMTLDEVIAASHALLDEVAATYSPKHWLVLFSGGNDSSLLTHLVRSRMDTAVHIQTTIGIPQTYTYVQAVCEAWNLSLTVTAPPDSYEDLVCGRVAPTTARGKNDFVWRGFPGPGAHNIMYQRLKEKALDRVRRDLVGEDRTRHAGRIAYVAGTRWSESDRRFRNASELDPAGSVVWVSPIVYWTNGHIAEYRERYRCQRSHAHAEHMLCAPDSLPLSEVSANLHMSGDCLCGAYAHPGELDEIAFFYPDVAEKIRRLERQVEDAGIPWCVWGAGKDAAGRSDGAPGRLCSSCVEVPGQIDMLDTWVDAGLLTAEQRDKLRGAA